MTKLRRMEIVLTNPQLVYFPGNVIEGQLQIDLSANMKMRGVRVKCRGKGHVTWTEQSRDNTTEQHSASEDYIDTRMVVYGNGPESGGEVVLHEGCHVFPFQFVLAPNLPGSYEGKSSCYVRYWLKGTIDKPWKFDPETKMLFTVGSVLDLNTVPAAMTSATKDDSKTVCCCCCESDPINATLRINKTGFVPGEAIICDAEIAEGTGRGTHSSKIKLLQPVRVIPLRPPCEIVRINKAGFVPGEAIICDAEIAEGTGRGTHSSKIKLLQTVTYRTHSGSKTVARREHNECGRLTHGPIQPGGSDVFSGEALVIPPLPPSYLSGCSIIDIDYVVQLCVDVIDTPFDLDVTVGVIIGTIPLQSVVQQYMPQLPVANQPVPMGAPVNFNLPPPTYQDCMFGKVDTTDDDDKHAGGNMSYAPQYTYYDWINPPPVPSAPAAPTGGFS